MCCLVMVCFKDASRLKGETEKTDPNLVNSLVFRAGDEL